MESRKADRLRDNLHLIQDGQRAKHTFFVDSKKAGLSIHNHEAREVITSFIRISAVGWQI